MQDQFKTPDFPGVTLEDFSLDEINTFFDDPDKRSTLKTEAAMAVEPAILLWGAYVMHRDNPTQANENWLIVRFAKYMQGVKTS